MCVLRCVRAHSFPSLTSQVCHLPSPTCPWSSLQSSRGPWGEMALFPCFVEGPGGPCGTSESYDFPISWAVNSPGKCPIKTHSHVFWENSSSLEKELKSEKEQRQALQRELQHEKDTSSLLRAELQQVEGLKKVRQTLLGRKRAFSISRKLCSRAYWHTRPQH